MRNSEFDKTRRSWELRMKVAQRVKQGIPSMERFAVETCSIFGVNSNTMRAYLTSVKKGRAMGSILDRSANRTYTDGELKKLAYLLNLLGLNKEDGLITAISCDYPGFLDLYKSVTLGESYTRGLEDIRFSDLLASFHSISHSQTGRYLRGLRGKYDSCDSDDSRRQLIRNLEADLAFIEGEGIFETLLQGKE